MQLEEKVKIWRTMFYGRQSAFGRREHGGKNPYSPYFKDKTSMVGSERYKPLEDTDVVTHLNGSTDLLIYLLHEDSTVGFAALDFDLKHDFHDVMKCANALDALGIPRCVARSSKKGYHLYVFFSKTIAAKYPISLFAHMYEEIGFAALNREGIKVLPETFPKTTHIDPAGLALGFGIKPAMQGEGIKKDRCCFVDDNDKVIGGIGTSDDQWEYLKNSKRISPEDFANVMSKFNIPVLENVRVNEKRGLVDDLPKRSTPYVAPTKGDFELVIDGCSALKEIWENGKDANQEQRIALLNIAINTKNGVAALRKKWPSDKTEYFINNAINHNYKPHSCESLQMGGVCTKGKHPRYASEMAPILESGEILNDYCLDPLIPMAMEEGKLVPLDKAPRSSPSPFRFAFGGKKKQERLKKDKKDKKKREADNNSSGNGGNDEPPPNQGDDNPTADGPQPFVVEPVFINLGRGRGYAKEVVLKDETYNARLSNFTIELESEMTVTDYHKQTETYMTGKIYRRGDAREFKIAAEDWFQRGPFLSLIGTTIGGAGQFSQSNLDAIRSCIAQFGMENCMKQTATCDFGFDSYEKPTRYTTQSGDITADGWDTSNTKIPLVNGEVEKLKIDLKWISDEEFESVSRVIIEDLMTFHDPGIARIMVTQSLQAAIHKICIPYEANPLVWIHGLTGAGKSTLTKLCAAFYSTAKKNVSNAESTINWMNHAVMATKDAIFCVDDYRLNGRIKPAEIAQFIQRSFDAIERGRLTQKKGGGYTMDEAMYNRGLTIINGEGVVHMDAAVVSRCIVLDYPIGNPDTAKLERIRRVEHLFTGFTSRFIQHILCSMPDKFALESRFRNTAKTFKKQDAGDEERIQNGERIANNLACNFISFEVVIDWLVKEEMLGPSDAQKLIEAHMEYLKGVNVDMRAICFKEQTSNVFIEALKEMLATGVCHIRGLYVSHGLDNVQSIDAGKRNYSSKEVGFASPNDNEHVYLYPQTCVGLVNDFMRKQPSGQSMMHDKDAIGAQLNGDGVLMKKEEGKLTRRVRVSTKLIPTWCITRATLGIPNALTKEELVEIKRSTEIS